MTTIPDLPIPFCPTCGDPVTSGCYPGAGICAVVDDEGGPTNAPNCWDQCEGRGWVPISGKVLSAPVGYETVTECQACNADGHIPYFKPGTFIPAIELKP